VADKLNIAVLIGSSLAWREQIMRGIAEYAHERRNWHVYTSPEGEEDSVFFSGSYRWDGLIIRPSHATFLRRVLRQKAPLVTVGSMRPTARNIARVKVNDRENTAIILRHLLSGGIRHFAYCSLLPSLAVEDRGSAFIQNVRHAGYECECFSLPQARGGREGWQQRQRLLGHWLRELPKPVGILTWSPDVACQVVEACNRLGTAIPGDVAVVAADDDRMKCELSRPTITAAEIPAHRIGYEAAKLLDGLIAGAPVPTAAIEISPSGVIAFRESTAIDNPGDREVHHAMKLIQQRAASGLSVKELADSLRVSLRWLERHFQRVRRRSPAEEIAQVRLETAKRLLMETDLPASRIAKASGFCTPSHMNRILRQETSLTPMQFRERFRL